MKREEILAKSRKDNKDEYVDKVFKDAQPIAFIVLVAVCTIFAAARVLKGQPFFEFPAILFAYSAATHYYNFFRIKNKYYLISAMLFTVAFICLTTVYLIKDIINR
jgi:hypothetical protein